MLDAPGYPKAFVETNEFRMEFREARKYRGRLIATVEFVIDAIVAV